ncbi:MAG: 2,3-bisphosphoglycerate-independent phosphoglycerate mutase [Saprospiraceae bacterium]|nr:2,3-bisphosphoglycerate-independent phosphoglycerate mutase [Saprospiraceae bacterium]
MAENQGSVRHAHKLDARMLLVILDGWGHSPDPSVSAIDAAEVFFMRSLYQKYPHAELVTHGEAVGLPNGQMGNSEVGHLNIGAGRIIYQELARINRAISDKTLHENPVLREALEHVRTTGTRLHLIGLVSDGGVHSHIDHLKALCDITQEAEVTEAYIHAFTDGRDVDPKSGARFVRELQEHLNGGQVRIASIVGRYYAMDRDKRWERVKLAYDLLVHGKGERSADLAASIEQMYAEGITDEFLKPICATDAHGEPLATIQDGDTVLFFNFRTDRPRQLTLALSQEDLPDFDMRKLDLRFVTMTSYDDTFAGIDVLFTNDKITNTLGDWLAQRGKTQLRIAETEKYPHVTYFFSGGEEDPFPGEERILIPSPKVATYDLQPEMSAPEVTEAAIQYIAQTSPDFICLNFANTDMVGHTGVFEAAVRAAETVDHCMSHLVPHALEHGYGILVIADHGNSDTMINPDGSVHTAHTKNPVPIIYVSRHACDFMVHDGKLADVAPTILACMGMPVPDEMDGMILVSALPDLVPAGG